MAWQIEDINHHYGVGDTAQNYSTVSETFEQAVSWLDLLEDAQRRERALEGSWLVVERPNERTLHIRAEAHDGLDAGPLRTLRIVER